MRFSKGIPPYERDQKKQGCRQSKVDSELSCTTNLSLFPKKKLLAGVSLRKEQGNNAIGIR